MTITPATLYWLTRLDALNVMCVLVLFFSIVGVLITSLQWGLNEPYDEEDKAPYRKWYKRETIVAIITALVLIFTPSSKQIAMFYVVPHITESQVIKQDLPELYDLGVNALKDWLKKENKGGNNE